MTKRMPTRAKVERAAYGASAVALAALPQIADPAINTAVLAVGGGSAWWLYRKAKTRNFPKLLTTAQKTLPVLTGAGLYTAAVLSGGYPLETAAEMLAAPALWGSAMCSWLPVTRSGWTYTETGPTTFEGIIAKLWTDSTVSQGTHLENIERTGTPDSFDFTARIVAPEGTAVPHLALRDVAAVFRAPVPGVTVDDEPGVGPGYARLTVVTSTVQKGEPLEAWWAERIAAQNGAIPGSEIADIKEVPGDGHTPGRMMLLAQVDPGQVASVNYPKLCTAYGVKAEELRLIAETDGGSQALVTLYDHSPLTGMRKATRELVTPDARGYWVAGTAHDGTDAEARLFDEKGALHGYLVGVTGSGKTVAFVLCLAAQANAGGVSWMASLDPDAQLAAAGEYIDRQGAGRTYAARATRAAVALMEIRGEINKEVGHDFSAHSPYPLLVLNLDEFNGLCDDSPEGLEIAENTTYISERGRKYGIGVNFGGQSLDLARIGGQRSLREQTRSGTGIVLRTVSGISGRQATEGMLPEGVTLPQIPTEVGGGLTMTDRMNGALHAVRGESTAGMGHVLTGGGAPRMMRVLYVHLPKDGTGHSLDEVFPEGGVVNTLTDREIEALGDLYGDWEADDEDVDIDGELDADAFSPPPLPETDQPKKATVKDQILAVVTHPMTAREIRGVVDAAAGAVRNALSELTSGPNPRLTRLDHGVYAPADHG